MPPHFHVRRQKAQMNPRLSKWLRWLDIIKLEIQDLVVSKYTFHEIQKMILENAKLQVDNSFYRYVSSTYVSHALIGLRRQVKKDSQSISLALLLQELVDTPEVLSRTYYVALYEGSTIEDRADKDFDRFAVPGAAHIDPTLVERDLQRLRDVTTKCEKFADKRIAHRDKHELKFLPTYNEVDDCIDLLNELYVTYLSMFEAKAMDTLLPTRQYDWKEIFRTPWIPAAD